MVKLDEDPVHLQTCQCPGDMRQSSNTFLPCSPFSYISQSLLSIFPLAPSSYPLSLPSSNPSPFQSHIPFSPFPLSSPLSTPLPSNLTPMESEFPLISPTVCTGAEKKCLFRKITSHQF